MSEMIKCYRLYAKGECVGTYFNRTQALFVMGDWFSAGYTADDMELKTENYES